MSMALPSANALVEFLSVNGGAYIAAEAPTFCRPAQSDVRTMVLGPSDKSLAMN